jgi:hypothetical protein
MEFLWNNTGATPEQYRSNTVAQPYCLQGTTPGPRAIQGVPHPASSRIYVMARQCAGCHADWMKCLRRAEMASHPARCARIQTGGGGFERNGRT